MKRALLLHVTGLLGLAALLATGGCRQQETKPTMQRQADSRLRAVEQAEMKRQAQQHQAQQNQPPPSEGQQGGGAQQATGAPAPASQPQATPGPAAQPYLPPSEQGAYVEMTETPAGSPPPPPRQAGAAAARQAGAPDGPGAQQTRSGGGGTMPSGSPAPAPAAGSPAGVPQPGGPAGQMSPGSTPPPVSGVATAPVQTRAEQVGTLNTELERKMREFDELMKRAQIEADKERAAMGRAGAREGRTGGRGGALETLPDEFGAGGAARDATGIGASPDLSGETSSSGTRQGGPSAGRVPGGEDDDIVARQLREAAERERDAVLREKLWAEYRKYKAQ